jgi:hypothetical protein
MEISSYVLESLEMGRGKLRARFVNEFSEEERQQLAAYLREIADEDGYALGSHLDDWERDVPEIARYW